MESKGKPERAPRPTVALMYHALAGVDERGQDPHYTLSEAAFRQHLTQILVHHGCGTSARDWFSTAERVGTIITFADGHLSRPDERRVGKECVSTCRSRWSAYH